MRQSLFFRSRAIARPIPGDVDKIIEVIESAATPASSGDGKIWCDDLTRVVRIRTGERGDAAI